MMITMNKHMRLSLCRCFIVLVSSTYLEGYFPVRFAMLSTALFGMFDRHGPDLFAGHGRGFLIGPFNDAFAFQEEKEIVTR